MDVRLGKEGLAIGRRNRCRLAAAVLTLALAGCGWTDPYVFKGDEFNRDSPTFNKPRADGEPVSICFNGIGTTDLKLQQMADAECARYGKKAQLVDTTVRRCPLAVPQEAVFSCVAAAPG
ncbi:MAG: hypothetical protein U1E66_05340 [Rhodospirillales bacterium]